MVLLLYVTAGSLAMAQTPVITSHNDNMRSGANTTETLLTPQNVNKTNFGHLWHTAVDYVVMAQPLYVPNVTISGQGVHNVVYVVTQNDSVYALDAQTGNQLWYASMLNTGGVAAAGKYLPCGTGPGFYEEGIVGTPVIDLTTNTIYLIAKTQNNGTVYHYLHALDITSGAEKTSLGSPVQIVAQVTNNKGKVVNFQSLHEKNRPGLLELNGVIYAAFGSNSCDDTPAAGWVIGYNASNIQEQVGAFDASADIALASIWQSGVGIAADEQGYIYAETAESTGYTVPSGGESYSDSVLKITPSVELQDYFTPWDVAYINSHDEDLSSAGVVVLPDQPGSYPHEAVATGKEGTVYLLNRDAMGEYQPGGPTDPQIPQELLFVLGPNCGEGKTCLNGAPVYWNNSLYFTADGAPIMEFPLVNGLLGTPVQSTARYNGGHPPSISANGTTNGILWTLTGPLNAFDAVSLKMLYNTNQNTTRDKLPPIGHFVTQTVADGLVFVGTQSSVECYGLFDTVSITGGNNQSAPVLTTLPNPLQVTVSNPYSGQPDVGVTVTFTDGGKGGTFNPTSAVTDSNGNASSYYTFPKTVGTYTLTATAAGFGSLTATETATAAAAAKLITYGGAKQSAAAGSSTPKPIQVEVEDANNNPVPGVTVNFTANNGGVPNPASAVSGSNGLAATYLQMPTKVATITVTASSSGLKNVTFVEYAVAGPAAQVTVTGGNNQEAPAGQTLPIALTVTVVDQYGNAVSGASVSLTDNGAGGTFSANPVTTGSTGTASTSYTLPASSGSITIDATVAGVSAPGVFSETSE